MQDHTVTLIVALAGIAGTLGASIATPYLTAVSERKQWIRDHARVECQELLAAVALTFQAMMAWDAVRNKHDEQEKEAFGQYEAAFTEMHKINNTRLLIAKQVNKAKLVQKWEDACIKYMNDFDSTTFAAVYDYMRNSIVEMGVGL